MQNKAVAEQGLEEGEEEENRGKEEVEDMGLGWMEACCMALDLHAAEPAVQVSSPPPTELQRMCNIILVTFRLQLQEAASWAIHSLLLHGAGASQSEEEVEERYTLWCHLMSGEALKKCVTVSVTHELRLDVICLFPGRLFTDS